MTVTYLIVQLHDQVFLLLRTSSVLTLDLSKVKRRDRHHNTCAQKKNSPPTNNNEQIQTLWARTDAAKINGLEFFTSISRDIMFRSAEYLTSQRVNSILASINNIKQVYFTRGLIFNTMNMDGEFERLRAELAGIQIHLNMVSMDNHVSEVERNTRKIKERLRCLHNKLPFKRIPDCITINIVYAHIFWLNAFPNNGGN